MKSKAKLEFQDVTMEQLHTIVDAIELSRKTKVKFKRFAESGVILIIEGKIQKKIYHVKNALNSLADYAGVNACAYGNRNRFLGAQIEYHGDPGNH